MRDKPLRPAASFASSRGIVVYFHRTEACGAFYEKTRVTCLLSEKQSVSGETLQVLLHLSLFSQNPLRWKGYKNRKYPCHRLSHTVKMMQRPRKPLQDLSSFINLSQKIKRAELDDGWQADVLWFRSHLKLDVDQENARVSDFTGA